MGVDGAGAGDAFGDAAVNFERPKRTVDRVFLHCSASDLDLGGPDLMALIRKWHVKERGFKDIGYHFVIDKAALVMHARGLEVTPAAQRGHNPRTIAICAHGLEAFTPGQLHAVHGLCRQINAAYHGRISFHGHREVANKTCPVFDYKALLNLDRWQRMP